jgi:hypothetical protein
MNCTRTLLSATVMVGCIAFDTDNAQAHHSFSMFDNAKCVSISGTVRNFQWSFPHSWIWLNVPDRKGGVAVWGFEGEPPSNLAQYGWKKNTLKKGDKVSLRFSPLKSGQNGGAYSVATLADGTVMTGARGRNDTCVASKL